MKKILIYLLVTQVFLFLSCAQHSGSPHSIGSKSIRDSFPNDGINPIKNYNSGMGNRLENFVSINPSHLPSGTIIPFTGKIRKSEIYKYGFILDTLGFNNDSSMLIFNHIYGVSQTNYFIFNYITPEHEEDKLIYFSDSDSTIIIPFRYDLDQEGTILTKWRNSGIDSLEYLDYFRTPFGTKYARIEILEVTKHKGKQFLIGKTHFGEGGEYGEEIWFARVLWDNRLNIHNLTSCGWKNDSDTIPTLQYVITKDGIKVYKANFQSEKNTVVTTKHLFSKEYCGLFKFTDY